MKVIWIQGSKVPPIKHQNLGKRLDMSVMNCSYLGYEHRRHADDAGTYDEWAIKSISSRSAAGRLTARHGPAGRPFGNLLGRPWEKSWAIKLFHPITFLPQSSTHVEKEETRELRVLFIEGTHTSQCTWELFDYKPIYISTSMPLALECLRRDWVKLARMHLES